MSHDDHIYQHPQHKHPFQLLEGHGSLPGTPQELMRAVLWRQRMKLEFEMQGLLLRTTTPCSRVAASAWLQRSGGKRGIQNCEPHPARWICRITAGTDCLATFLRTG